MSDNNNHLRGLGNLSTDVPDVLWSLPTHHYRLLNFLKQYDPMIADVRVFLRDGERHIELLDGNGGQITRWNTESIGRLLSHISMVGGNHMNAVAIGHDPNKLLVIYDSLLGSASDPRWYDMIIHSVMRGDYFCAITPASLDSEHITKTELQDSYIQSAGNYRMPWLEFLRLAGGSPAIIENYHDEILTSRQDAIRGLSRWSKGKFVMFIYEGHESLDC